MAATYTDQQILDATLDAIYALTVSGAKQYSLLGRNVTKNNLEELRENVKFFEARVAAAASDGRPAVVKFRNPS